MSQARWPFPAGGGLTYEPPPHRFGEGSQAPEGPSPSDSSESPPPPEVIPSADALAPLHPPLGPRSPAGQIALLEQIDELAALRGGPDSFIAGAICALQWCLDTEVNPPPVAEAVWQAKEGE